MPFQKLKKVAICMVGLTLAFGAFQNCAPIGTPEFALQTSNSSVPDPTNETAAQKFSETLQPILTTNCGACHGLSQVPRFAVTDPDAGYATINQFGLVDLTNPESSYFITKIRSGHNGFTETLAQQVLSGINAWKTALAENTGTLDQQSPGVIISSPIAGSTVSGTITLSAMATDNVSVTSVRFLIDNITVGSPDTTSPYSISIDTAVLSNGNHTLTAIALDPSGNVGSSTPISINVMNNPAF